MTARTKLATYGLVLAAVLGGGAAVGTAAGPIDVGGSADHGPAGHDGGSATTVPSTTRTTDAVDGYELSAEVAPHASEVTVTVRRDGAPVTTEPHLGSAGHLVALRDGDLAYVHTHASDGRSDDVGAVDFAVDFPAAGTYSLFFDFKVDEVVRTAHFVIEVPHATTHGG